MMALSCRLNLISEYHIMRLFHLHPWLACGEHNHMIPKSTTLQIAGQQCSPYLFHACFLSRMFPNTIKDSNEKILTSKIWRKCHAFFKDLPFYSNIPQMEEMAGLLIGALGPDRLEKSCMEVLVVSEWILKILI